MEKIDFKSKEEMTSFLNLTLSAITSNIRENLFQHVFLKLIVINVLGRLQIPIARNIIKESQLDYELAFFYFLSILSFFSKVL